MSDTTSEPVERFTVQIQGKGFQLVRRLTPEQTNEVAQYALRHGLTREEEQERNP